MVSRIDRELRRRVLRQLGEPEDDPIALAMGIFIVQYGVDLDLSIGFKCHYCKERLATTRDHVVPHSKGGTSAWWNLVPCCKACNKRKSDDMPTCACAYCARAVMLYDFGIRRPDNSGRP